ncbi:urea ABC transporter permease subunit UrtC [Leptolyngbya sp. FACHB-36]|uniref:urea ABC transporter permease subunit UrtC n=1 Tax=Leptolyngbya sp. FACHB-36 TaxID=2692808 RepID=UPI001680778B|nr:urea ABC transporter permease subunit UrtC [Leptolyngbya sp. FACHB-36]MBD2019042.1 urea ABC transporter permease subunit UrtC [Leptolyngbya sp. FACHB-36]
MTEVMGRLRQSAVPKRLLITTSVLLLILVVLPFVAGGFQTNLMAKLLLFGALGVSLDLVWGFAGILSFAHGVFFTLGGYAMAYYLKLNLSASANTYGGSLPDFMVWNGLKELPWFIAPLQFFPIAAFAMVAVPAGFAYIIGWFIFRSKVSGVYITIITLAISSALTTFFVSQQAYTGGTNGITDVSSLSLFGLVIPPIGLYFIILVFTVFVIAASWWLTQSNFGLILRSIQENEQRISYLGYDVASFKIFIWTLSAGIAGIAGGLFVPLNKFISPVYLAVAFGTQIVIWVAVGGRGTLFGPVIAAILLGQVQNYADRVTQDWQLVVGVLLLIVVLFLPDGLMGLVPKQFKLNDSTRLGAIVRSNSAAGFVRASLFDWYTPLQNLVQQLGHTLFDRSRSSHQKVQQAKTNRKTGI